MQKTRRFHGRIDSDTPPPCARPGCGSAGEFRAPRSRRQQDWQFLCLEHVREFNQHWDYCAGMSQSDIDNLIRSGNIWDRKTRRIGVDAGMVDPLADDTFGLFPDLRKNAHGRAGPPPRGERERRALAMLGLDVTADRQDIKTAYRKLVRRYHPDFNGGERRMEGRLRNVIAAYRHLMDCERLRA